MESSGCSYISYDSLANFLSHFEQLILVWMTGLISHFSLILSTDTETSPSECMQLHNCSFILNGQTCRWCQSSHLIFGKKANKCISQSVQLKNNFKTQFSEVYLPGRIFCMLWRDWSHSPGDALAELGFLSCWKVYCERKDVSNLF